MNPGAASVATLLILALMGLNLIAQLRFYRSYLHRYGDEEVRRRHRLWPLPLTLGEFTRRRAPWTAGTLFRRLDDPVVEGRRRQLLLAWAAVFAFLILGPIIFAMTEA